MADLEITEVRVRPFTKGDEKLKAFATITFNNCFIVTDLKVIKGNKGLFVAMPSKKRKDGTFKDVAHPLNNETRRMIEENILAAYEKSLQEEEPMASFSETDDDDVAEAEQVAGEPEPSEAGRSEELEAEL